MAWWNFASAALPIVAGALTPRPDSPTYQPYDYGYGTQVDQIMADAFNPSHQSELYRLANERAFADLNRNLANIGAGNSSLMVQGSRGLAADLANQRLENEMRRRAEALKIGMGYQDAQRNAGMDLYKMGEKDYQYADMPNRELIGGLGAFSKEIGQYYGQQQASRQRDRELDIQAARYGVPSYR